MKPMKDNTNKEKEKYVPMGTKVSPAMADVINAICDSLGVDVYHLLQQFLYTMVRASHQQHELSPEIQKIMTLMETDAGWQNAFNICNPDGLKVSQVVLILEQENKKGFGAVMINKPWCGASTQTECVDEILERVTEVTMRGIYRRLRNIGGTMQCGCLSDILLRMIDAQTIIELDELDRQEICGRNDIADNGRAYAYGKKTKAKQHRTIDNEAHRQQMLAFDDIDRDEPPLPVDDWEGEQRGDSPTPEELEDQLGCRPFGAES